MGDFIRVMYWCRVVCTCGIEGGSNMNRLLDQIDRKHPILTRAAMLLIAFAALYVSAQIDKQNDAAIRWMVATRAT